MCKFATFQSSECEFNIFALDKAKLHSCWQQRARLRGCPYIRPNLKSQAEIAPPRWWLSAVFVKPGPLLQLLSTLAQSRRFTYHMTRILHKMIFVSAACSSRRRYQTMMMIKWGKCAWRTNCNSTMQHGCKWDRKWTKNQESLDWSHRSKTSILSQVYFNAAVWF